MSLLSILLASLIGSPHCAGMCGGFVGIASQMSNPRRAQVGYHMGRLITYLTLGGLAGFFGKEINHIGSALGIDRLAALITGSIMILLAGSILIGRPLMVSRYLPASLFAIPSRMLSSISKKGGWYAVLLGLFSTLLPCGWLYTYVAVAGASGTPEQGVLIMAFFWLGTLPILLTVGSLAQLVGAPLRRYAPTVTAILMLVAGFFALTGHMTFLPSDTSAVQSTTCHPERLVGADGDQTVGNGSE